MKYTKDQIIKELVALLPTEHDECEDNWYSCEKSPGYRGRNYENPDFQPVCDCGLDHINETLERLGIKR